MKKEAKRISSFVFMIAALVCLVLLILSGGKTDVETAYALGKDTPSTEIPSRPVIIWWARLWDDPEILRLAISSGVFSHVMLVSLHEFDRPGDIALSDPNLVKAVRYCKEKGVKVVWTRWLYPGYNQKKFKFKDAFDADYYKARIRELKSEAKAMGADYVAFDAEPYAKSVLTPYKTLRKCKLSKAEFNDMNRAIQVAVEAEGKVDFILPAATRFGRHLFDATRNLGELAVNEDTYYDVPARRRNIRRYDIFGAYVGVRKKNDKHPKLPLFTPREILERQDLWAHTSGLFIYPGSAKNTALVAREFSKIKKVSPAGDDAVK